jgi:hypothetical protein
MKQYKTDMDGFSLVQVDKELNKDDLVLVNGNFEQSFYKVSEVTDEKAVFKLFKYIEPEKLETSLKYTFEGIEYNFVNRPSKNQSIYVNEKFYKILDIEKETKTLILEELPYETVNAVYVVYNNELTGNSRDPRRVVEKQFLNWSDAHSYIVDGRSKGKKLSR